ncbi:MAG TPA: ABC transporter permease [Vicinamibacterales bacterium]
MMRRTWRRLLNTLSPRDRDADMADELQLHIDLMAEEQIRRGVPREDAYRQARIKFGNLESMKERYRDQRGLPAVETAATDLRYAVRLMWRNPGFAAVAILSLAIGIGANTAIFSVLNAAFFAPYGIEEPERLVRLWGQDLKRNILQLGFSVPKYELIRDHQTSFESIGAMSGLSRTLLLNGTEPIQVNGALSTSSFLDTFGATPLAGRFFRGDEEHGATVAVIGERLWRDRFAGDPSVIGRGVTVDGVVYTVIGVAQALPAFWDADIWTTNPFEYPGVAQDAIRRGFSYLQPIGRLKRGVTEEQARRELDVLARQFAAQYPGNADAEWTLTAIPLRDDIVGTARSSLLTLMAAVGLLLVVACANVANLLLVRFTGRRQEIGLRAALGASRARIIRQFMAESLLLSMAAAAAGALLAYWTLPALVTLAQNNLAFASDIRISVPVLAATMLLALGVGVIMGAYPAMQGSRSDIVSVLRDGGRTIAGAQGSHRARRLIVTAQVAVSLVLLIGAGLLIASFDRLRSQPAGFDSERIFVAGLNLPSSRYPDLDSHSRFWLRLASELSNTAGVERAALSAAPPLSGAFARSPYALSEGAVPPLNERPLGLTTSVTPGYFATMHIPLLAGRDFTEADDARAPRVAIVSRATSRKLGGDQGLLGRRIIMGASGEVMEVVGVVEDVRTQSLAATSEVEFYRPVQQRGRPFMQMMVKTTGDPAAFEATARRVLSTLDATLPLTGVTTHERLVAQSLAQQRLMFVMLGAFAVLAVVLSSVGIYGVVASYVGQRTPELGVRMALGASRMQVIAIVLGQSLVPVGAGLLVGLFGAMALGRFVQDLLFETSPLDPIGLSAAVMLLTLVASIACVVPARRAALIDPVTALRGE